MVTVRVCAERLGGLDEAPVKRARVESAGASAERGSGAGAGLEDFVLQRLVPEAEVEARRVSLTGRSVSACVGSPRVVCSFVGSAEAAWWDCADLVWVLGKWVEGLECRWWWGEVERLGSMEDRRVVLEATGDLKVRSGDAGAVLELLGADGALCRLRRLGWICRNADDAEAMGQLLSRVSALSSLTASGIGAGGISTLNAQVRRFISLHERSYGIGDAGVLALATNLHYEEQDEPVFPPAPPLGLVPLQPPEQRERAERPVSVVQREHPR